MRLDNHKVLGFIINFLLGIAWAATLLGAITSFLILYHDSIPYAIVSAAIGTIPGLVAILLIEHFITNQEILHELQKQTKLIEESLLQR